ncbi:penicillin-binding protein 2 [Collinsella sp. AGMB00827]|uniref:Penicillin-binding protein 2 n=2 Tax=Collinsella ureilytica TaxID=2869515 RepID=A0ABS7MHX5_9ACTN|nr:penicillin-binding protein 2 [Collinsella urealyticum]
MGLLATLTTGKLAELQLINAEQYRREANIRRLASQTLFSKRGTIYDRNGNVLVSSVECKNVYVNPKLITDVDAAVNVLVDVLGVDAQETRELCEADTTFCYIAHQVDQEDADKIADHKVDGIEFEQTTKRIYPYGPVASQVLGVVNRDGEGVSGLELYYDELLRGTDGSIVRERARDGGFIAGGAYEKKPATDGIDLVLSLDVNIQMAAEEAIAKGVADAGAKYGSAIVCDPTTGEILAACSYPTYDQSDLSNARTEDMNLRVVTDAYEPGSVFKTLVAGMGIDLGIMNPDTIFYVPPTVLAGDDPVRDVDKRDYAMDMTLREILRRSSNTGMILVGEKIGADEFASYLKKYGLGTGSGIDFSGESPGIIKKREEYDGASVASMSFGQSIAVSPIEILRAETGIANGGMMSAPHFLKSKQGEEVDWSHKQERCISAEAADQVVSMMKTVVAEGTGSSAQIEGYTIAGKTGTAERAGAGGYQSGNNMASFIGFVAQETPKAMTYITLDGTANMSGFAIAPFKTIMASAIKELGIARDTA